MHPNFMTVSTSCAERPSQLVTWLKLRAKISRRIVRKGHFCALVRTYPEREKSCGLDVFTHEPYHASTLLLPCSLVIPDDYATDF